MIHHLFHYIFFLFITLIIFFDIFGKTNKKYIFVFNTLYITLGLLGAFRFGVGIDTPNYMFAFEYVPKLTDLKSSDFSAFRFQPLYLLINSFSKSIYNDFVIVQIFQNALLFSSMYIVLRLLKMRKFYILFFFYLCIYFTDALSAMRESFALSFAFCSSLFYTTKMGQILFTYLYCFQFSLRSYSVFYFTVVLQIYRYNY